VAVRSPEAIADAILALLDPESWQVRSKHARVRFLEEYHPTVVRRDWLRLLEAYTSLSKPGTGNV
jgi:hypothetical protein